MCSTFTWVINGELQRVSTMPPSVVATVVVILIEPATLPVCTRIVVWLFGKMARVVSAGIVKLTVRPPVANCTAGSLAKTSELNASVSVPVRANG